MMSIEYVKGLIAGMEMGSSIPVQECELRFLLALMEAESKARELT